MSEADLAENEHDGRSGDERGSGSDQGETVEGLVLDAAKRILAERAQEATPVQAWVTGSEIAHLTGIDKHVVHRSLESLGHHELHIANVGNDIEVHGVNPGRGASSLDFPADEWPDR